MSTKNYNAAQGRTHEVATTTKPELCPPLNEPAHNMVKRAKEGLNYEGLNVSGINFYQISDLRNANFSHTDIHAPTWEEPKLCSLFACVDLRNATLRHANLRCGYFSYSKFDYADFSGADLRGAVFEEASLAHVDFRGADLRGAVFENVKLAHTNFGGADLSDAIFDGCYLCLSNLDGAIIHNTSFKGATIYKTQAKKLPFSDLQLKDIRTRYRNGERPKTIYQYNEQFLLVNQFGSLLEAETQTGIPMRMVKLGCMIGSHKVIIHGYRWSFAPLQG